ncbi:uncharacterized protein LOC132554958 [Ylistrum balloti]|uniref:uncharacterized protein LOC132554958 n=1 Tax=Ylistrum balloti TaxID=509963 RepID=UPI002905B34E|nr:uncharacterized protein LOC132554958 [Ylistrum balloti]
MDFSNNLFHSWKGPLLNLKHLKHADLSNNYCSYISDNFLMDKNRLETLLVQNNLLGLVLYKDVNGKIFRHLMSLKTLDLSRNHIYTLPALLLKNQHELQILNLSNNALNELSLDISHMKHLQYLDITHNQLRGIKQDQRDQIDSLKDNNLTINLQGNRMDCSCEELDFLKWLGRKKDLFEHFLTYKCAFSNGTEITFSNFDTTLLEISKSCDSYIGIIAVCASVILLSVTFVISGMIYRYRWKLRYLFYMAKTQYRGYRPVVNAEDDDDYLYDAFISYCSDDYMFVVKEMLIHLEDNHGLRLCLHQRDFIPGEDIAQNITNAIHQSRKTVIILSRNYLNSYWCMFEFNMARMESIYSRGGDSVLLLVFYEDIPPRDLPLSLLDIIESKTYIEYPRGDLHGNVVFWDELSKTSKTSVRSSITNISRVSSVYMKQRAKLEAAKVRLKFVEKEAELQKSLQLLKSQRELDEAAAELKAMDDVIDTGSPIRHCSQAPSDDEELHRKSRTVEFVQSQAENLNTGYETFDPYSHKVPLNVEAREFTPGQCVTGLNDLTKFMLKKDLLMGRLTQFTDKPEEYRVWKMSFLNVVKELDVSPQEQLDLLSKWLGPESRKQAVSLRAANIHDPPQALCKIWTRLSEKYGAPEQIELSLRERLNKFPKLTNRDGQKLFDLSNILAEIQAVKENTAFSSIMAYYDSSSGINPIVCKLPVFIQNKWTDYACRYQTEHNVTYPKFSVFERFIQEMSSRMNNPSFNYTDGTAVPSVSKEQRRTASTGSRNAYVFSKKTEVNNVPTAFLCPLHDSAREVKHLLSDCHLFLSKSKDEKREILKTRRVL